MGPGGGGEPLLVALASRVSAKYRFLKWCSGRFSPGSGLRLLLLLVVVGLRSSKEATEAKAEGTSDDLDECVGIARAYGELAETTPRGPRCSPEVDPDPEPEPPLPNFMAGGRSLPSNTSSSPAPPGPPLLSWLTDFIRLDAETPTGLMSGEPDESVDFLRLSTSVA